MGKLNRIYRLTVQLQDEQGKNINQALEIQNPFTVKFSVDRSIYAGLNSLDIDIYNLSPKNRNLLFQDVYGDRDGNYRNVILESGYQGQGMSVIFNGNVWSAYSKRNGVDVITHIYAIDGLSTQSGMINTTLKSGTTAQEVIQAAAGQLKDLKTGTMNIPDHTFDRPVVLAGNAYKILKTYSDDNVFVDMKTIHIMKPNDAIEGVIPLITDSSGLLATPERQDATLTIRMIFEPRLQIGQLIQVKSEIAPQFDGVYKIYGIKHNGTISDAVAENCTTTIQLQVGSQVFGRFNVLKAEQQQISK